MMFINIIEDSSNKYIKEERNTEEMAKIQTNSRIIEVKDGSTIRKACEELGIPFGCSAGICGTCMIEIISGMENLSELTEAEQSSELPPKTRLACQCKIKKGTVKINWE